MLDGRLAAMSSSSRPRRARNVAKEAGLSPSGDEISKSPRATAAFAKHREKKQSNILTEKYGEIVRGGEEMRCENGAKS